MSEEGYEKFRIFVKQIMRSEVNVRALTQVGNDFLFNFFRLKT